MTKRTEAYKEKLEELTVRQLRISFEVEDLFNEAFEKEVSTMAFNEAYKKVVEAFEALRRAREVFEV